MTTYRIQTHSTQKTKINPSWIHTPYKEMQFENQEDLIFFCRNLCLFLDVIVRVTTEDQQTGFLVSERGKLF